MSQENAMLSFDFSTCFNESGLTSTVLEQAQADIQKTFQRFSDELSAGKLGFAKLPATYLADNALADVENLARWAQQNFENLVVIGIGGSALGARMLQNGLSGRYHNELPGDKRSGLRIYLLENNDPDSFADLFNTVDLDKTLFNVISKSGSTIETASQFVMVRDRLRKTYGDSWTSRFIFTTDPKNGILRKIGEADGVRMLPVPSDVGGRYSVLSPVGLFPALAAGMDVRALLKGANDMGEQCKDAAIESNPALQGAAIHWLTDKKLNKNMVVAFPYSDRLRDWTEWFCQLWAESLGKETAEDGRTVNAGTTPIKTLGAIDQHSQSQLYMEGPDDKLFMFMRVEGFGNEGRLPAADDIPEDLRYLAGHSLQELINAEQTATRFALGKRGRMSYQVSLPKLDAYTLGQLVFWAEAMTVLAGYLYGVNPFDQPGVELSKQYAYGLMGRAGFEQFREEIEAANTAK